MSDRSTVRSESFASLLESRIALVAAHPDDEILGLGGCLAQIPAPMIVHVTDGAPRELSEALSAGFADREQYASARWRELIPLLASIEWVITHPYEGGHPDHDAAAFIVQAACARLKRAIGRAPQRLEFASYHARDGQIVRGEFWPDPLCPESAFTLDASQRARKRAALSQFKTQRSIIAAFPIEVERLRPAPRYDFCAPPPPGVALYDRFGWSVHSALWRGEAVRALSALELAG